MAEPLRRGYRWDYSIDQLPQFGFQVFRSHRPKPEKRI